jgi:competence protein ComEA
MVPFVLIKAGGSVGWLSKWLWILIALILALIVAGTLPRPAERVARVKTAADSGVIRLNSRALIDLNHADATLLQSIPGIGPALAARIEAYIDEKGALKAPEELLNVDGIGPEKLRGIEKIAAVLP